MKELRISRRLFVRMSALAMGGLVAACAPTPAPTAVPPTAAPKATVAPATVPPTAAPKATTAPTAAPKATTAPTAAPKAAAYKESPMLAELVKAGKLPPVEQRLPKDPLVVKPFEKIGKYGGMLRFGSVETNHQPYSNLQGQGLLTYDMENTKVSLDIAKTYKFSSDLKVLTVELREGHKWSDGQPFTTDDVMFWWEDQVNNKDLNPSGTIAAIWKPGNVPAVFKKVSPTVVEITFSKPWPVIQDWQGRSGMATDSNFFLPKHWLSKYHLKYNPQANEIAKENKFDDWTKAWGTFRAGTYNTHNWPEGRPGVFTWIVETRTTDRAITSRNPYFHQVDTEGNQLPYIDKVESIITGNKEVHVLKATAGEFSFEGWYTALKDMAVYKQNADKGGYRVLTATSLRTAINALMPNRTAKDPVLNKLFNSLDFRIAMSVGMNRKAMNDSLYFGLATPFPATCSRSFSFFKPEWAKMYIDHDVAKANQLLDGLGLTQKDAQGFRLRPDGKGRLSVIIEIGSPEGPKMEISEMIATDWKAIGIEAVPKQTEGTLYNQRMMANELEIATWHTDRAIMFGRANPLFFGFDEPSQQRWATQWTIWFQTGGKDGIEPPEEIKKYKAVHDKWRETLPGTPDFDKYGGEYWEWFTVQCHMIGTVGYEPIPILVNNKLRNVLEKDIRWSSDGNFYQPYWPTQWYFES